MKYTRLSLFAFLMQALLAVACTEELDDSLSGYDAGYKEVPVSLNLEVSEELAGTPSTKSVDDNSSITGYSPKIKNICILQFAGKDDDARLVGDVRYYAVDSGGGNVLDMSDIRLVDSAGKEHTLVILANTFTRLPRFETLGKLLDQKRIIDCQADLFGHEGQHDNFPDDATYYQRLNGLAVTTVAENTPVKALLRRSMARVRVNVSNTGKDGLVINSIQLRNVPKTDYYVSDYRYNASDELSLRETPFHDQYDPKYPRLMDYPACSVEYTPGMAQSEDFTFYTTCNQRGTIVNDNPFEKNRLCKNIDATYLEILGSYGADHDKPIRYTFYLGADLKQDFNINPNTSYNYDISFDGKGNLELDSRISDCGGVDFDKDSNCYILNPPSSGVASYSFNVVHRTNLFWGDRYGINSETSYVNNYIYPTDKWYARIIWSDFEMSREEAMAFLVTTSGNASGSYMDANQRITVNVPAGHQGGNVLVGIYKNEDAPEQILWSWHLWITDYAPDKIAGLDPVEGQYIYTVPSGQVHRYSDIGTDGLATLWAPGGRYDRAFIMDRALGSLDDKNHWLTETTCKFYQFGRKDPFNSDMPVWSYDGDFNPSRSVGSDGKDNGMVTRIAKSVVDAPSQIVGGVPNGGMNTGGHNIPYAVMHPTYFIYDGSSWSAVDNDTFSGPTDKNGDTMYWRDPDPTCREVDYEEVSTGSFGNKSFFDPCPQGWRLPVKGFINMPASTFVRETAPQRKNNYDSDYGVFYLDGSQSISFPYLPYRASNLGTIYCSTMNYLWTASPNGKNYGISQVFNGLSSNAPSCGFPVRCIREE